MNKKIILISVILIILILSVSFFFLFFSSDKVRSLDINKLLATEGKVKLTALNQLSIEVEENGLEQTKKTFDFVIDKNTKIFSLTNDIKTEEEFREEETAYHLWEEEKKVDSELEFRFPPVWNRAEEISINDLSVDDIIVVVYYISDNKLIAHRLQRKINRLEEATIEQGEEEFLSYTGEIKELNESVLQLFIDDIVGSMELSLIINDDTKVIVREKKADDVYKAEELAFIEKKKELKSSGGDLSSLEAPSWFNDREGNLNDLEIGDKINVKVKKSGNFIYIEEIEKVIN